MHDCGTFLIDQHTGKHYHLFSPFDNEAEPPLLSKKQDKLLVFSTNVFRTAAFVSVYKRSDTTENFDFETFESLSTDKWKIFEAVWINDTGFAWKVFEEYGGKTGNIPQNVSYVKGTIK